MAVGKIPQMKMLDLGHATVVPGFKKSRYILPKPTHEVSDKYILYNKAEELAVAISPYEGATVFVVVSGAFIFGDLVEALAIENDWIFQSLRICTLGVTEENLDSLSNLIHWERLEKLSLLVSDRFFLDEQHKGKLVPYAYSVLDVEGCDFALVVAGIHMKYVLMEVLDVDGRVRKIVIDGSANYRSCANMEQFNLRESSELFDFLAKIHDDIEVDYNTIDKSVQRCARVGELWGVVVGRPTAERKNRWPIDRLGRIKRGESVPTKQNNDEIEKMKLKNQQLTDEVRKPSTRPTQGLMSPFDHLRKDTT